MYKVILFLLLSIFSYASQIIYLQPKWKDSFQFAGFYMAKQKGFYKKAGLNVHILEYKDNTNIINKVLDNNNTYAVAGSELFYWALKGKKIELLMPILKRSPLALLSTNPSVKTLKDIQNKHVLIGKNALKNPSIVAMLKSKGIDIDKLNIAQSRYSIKDLLTKKEIFAIYTTDELYYVKKKKIKYHLFNPSSFGFDFYGDILFTSQNEVKNHPKRVKAFIKATKEGWVYAFKHINETINTILKYYNTQHLTYDKLKNEAYLLKPYMSENFKFNNKKIERIEDIYVFLNMISNKLDISNYIYNPLELTKKERLFIKSHIIKCISTPTWAPFNTMKNGKLVGIAIDYWSLIKKRLHLKSKCTIDNSWSNILYRIKHKTADLTISTTITPKREKYAVFSKPYSSFPIVIATRNNIGFISNMDFLKNKTVAVGKNYTIEKLIRKNYPSIKIIETKDTNMALKLVRDGRAFATADILPVIAYNINKYDFSNLKIAGRTPWKFSIRIMVRKDYKELIPAINKAINSITDEEKAKIYDSWISVHYQKGYTKNTILNIFIISIIIILITLTWIYYLQKEIAKRKKLEKELEKLATIDKLTSIYNRYKTDLSLHSQIEISKRYKRPLSLIFFDIDFFKKVNDSYGHKAGDMVLSKLCEIVSRSVRKSDIFGRWGGEEFLIILPETTEDEAISLAEKLRQKIEKYTFDKVKNITCSFGVTNYKNGDNSETIMMRVDKQLYKAKQNGRNRIEFV